MTETQSLSSCCSPAEEVVPSASDWPHSGTVTRSWAGLCPNPQGRLTELCDMAGLSLGPQFSYGLNGDVLGPISPGLPGQIKRCDIISAVPPLPSLRTHHWCPLPESTFVHVLQRGQLAAVASPGQLCPWALWLQHRFQCWPYRVTVKCWFLYVPKRGRSGCPFSEMRYCYPKRGHVTCDGSQGISHGGMWGC
jgi:hypothetical protein